MLLLSKVWAVMGSLERLTIRTVCFLGLISSSVKCGLPGGVAAGLQETVGTRSLAIVAEPRKAGYGIRRARLSHSPSSYRLQLPQLENGNELILSML